jgi:hypothetical protein
MVTRNPYYGSRCGLNQPPLIIFALGSPRNWRRRSAWIGGEEREKAGERNWAVRCTGVLVMSRAFLGRFRMAEEIGRVAGETPSSSSVSQSRWAWPSVLRWIPTSTERIIAAEKRLLSLVKYITYIIILDFLLSVEIFFFFPEMIIFLTSKSI